jgi:hypothetical protein
VLFELVKRSFDPAGILNPGVKVPVEGQRAIEAVKYDPAIEALPAAARRALDLVARERGYDRLRLALVDAADEAGDDGRRPVPPASAAGPADAGVGAEYEAERPRGAGEPG